MTANLKLILTFMLSLLFIGWPFGLIFLSPICDLNQEGCRAVFLSFLDNFTDWPFLFFVIVLLVLLLNGRYLIQLLPYLRLIKNKDGLMLDVNLDLLKEQKEASRESVTTSPGGDDESTFKQWWDFERIYRVIFKSQLGLMLTLDKSTTVKVQEIVDRFFEPAAKENHSLYGYGIDGYLGFLSGFGLVSYSGLQPDDTVTITPVGRGFIVYLNREGMLEGYSYDTKVN